MNARHISVGFASLLFVSLAAGVAQAEPAEDPASPNAGAAAPMQPNGCYVMVDRGVSLRVPANVPAIPLADRSLNAIPTLSVDPIGPVTFTSENDTRVSRAILLRPSDGLPLGSQTINFDIACSLPNAPKQGPGIVQLEVGPAAPLPTTIGTTTSGPVARISLSSEILPYSDVTAYTIRATESNVTYVAEAYGSFAHGVRAIELAYDEDNTTVPVSQDVARLGFPLRYAATDGTCGTNTGIKEVAFSIRAHVAGATNDPPELTTAVEIDCGRAKTLAEEAERRANGGGGTGGSGSSSTTTTSSGCSTSGGPGGGSGFGAFALALGLVGLGRRLSSRRS